jgi:hypothetical protein
MADTKISALPASTTPLAGTEVLPIVQSGVTKQVSVANLTAGRAISATQLTLTAGNLIVANGQGVDFSATPGTGTSELLADYEEGTFTPVLTFGGGSTGITYTTQLGKYTKIGDRLFFNITILLSNKGSSAGGAVISGLPFTVAESTVTAAFISNMSAIGSIPQFLANSTVVDLYYQTTGSNAQYTNGLFNNNTEILISGLYRV